MGHAPPLIVVFFGFFFLLPVAENKRVRDSILRQGLSVALHLVTAATGDEVMGWQKFISVPRY
jgi:hypothetical protein